MSTLDPWVVAKPTSDPWQDDSFLWEASSVSCGLNLAEQFQLYTMYYFSVLLYIYIYNYYNYYYYYYYHYYYYYYYYYYCYSYIIIYIHNFILFSTKLSLNP